MAVNSVETAVEATLWTQTNLLKRYRTRLQNPSMTLQTAVAPYKVSNGTGRPLIAVSVDLNPRQVVLRNDSAHAR